MFLFSCQNNYLTSTYAIGCNYGYYIQNSPENLFTSCFAGGTGTGTYGFFFDGTVFPAQNEGVRLNGCVTNGSGTAIAIVNYSYLSATGCSFSTYYDAGANITNSRFIRFENCELVGAKTSTSNFSGISMNAGTTPSPAPWGCMFVGCLVSGNFYGAVVYGQNHIFSGCFFDYNGSATSTAAGYDIGFNTGVTKSSITGCVFDNIAGSPPGEQLGGVSGNIYLFSGATYNLVANNICHAAVPTDAGTYNTVVYNVQA
jgi:hypothetical protein